MASPKLEIAGVDIGDDLEASCQIVSVSVFPQYVFFFTKSTIFKISTLHLLMHTRKKNVFYNIPIYF